jgi:tetratricopeptide (TPR) repeat protein
VRQLAPYRAQLFDGIGRRLSSGRRRRITGMITKWTLFLCASGLLASQVDWIADGNRALDSGRADEAAIDYARALSGLMAAGNTPQELAHLRVTLATAYLEAGDCRAAEATLFEARKASGPWTNGIARAELLNAWSSLYLKLGQLPEAEAELREALQITTALPNTGDLHATVLHNLAAVEMRTGRYTLALDHETDAMRRFAKDLAPNHPTMIRGWASMASLQYMLGEPREAKASLDRALESAEITYGPDSSLLADLLMSDAVVLDKLKLHAEARRAREQAFRIPGTLATAGDVRASWNVREPSPDGQVYLRSK